jgi:hypothetical protein
MYSMRQTEGSVTENNVLIQGECDCRMLATILSGLRDVATALLGHANQEDLDRTLP